MINTVQFPDDEGLNTLVWTLSEEVLVLKEEIAQALEEVRPQLQLDGGDIELVDVEDGVVKVRLKGSCAGCPMSQMTLKWGVENYLKKKVPGVKSVEAVQD